MTDSPRIYVPCPECDRSNMLEHACPSCKDNCHYCCECDREDVEHRFVLNLKRVSKGIAIIWAPSECEALKIFENGDAEVDFYETEDEVKMIRRE